MEGIIIESKICSVKKLRSLLNEHFADAPEEAKVELNSTNSDSAWRGMDGASLMAFTGVMGTALGALISGLFKVSETLKGQKVVIVGSSGRRIEAPVSCTPEELARFVELSGSMDVQKIVLLGPNG